jgi:hypothetical protein
MVTNQNRQHNNNKILCAYKSLLVQMERKIPHSRSTSGQALNPSLPKSGSSTFKGEGLLNKKSWYNCK